MLQPIAATERDPSSQREIADLDEVKKGLEHAIEELRMEPSALKAEVDALAAKLRQKRSSRARPWAIRRSGIMSTNLLLRRWNPYSAKGETPRRGSG